MGTSIKSNINKGYTREIFTAIVTKILPHWNKLLDVALLFYWLYFCKNPSAHSNALPITMVLTALFLIKKLFTAMFMPSSGLIIHCHYLNER